MESKNLSTFPIAEAGKEYEIRFDLYSPEAGKAYIRISKVPKGMAFGKGFSFDANGSDVESILNVFHGSDAGDIMALVVQGGKLLVQNITKGAVVVVLVVSSVGNLPGIIS